MSKILVTGCAGFIGSHLAEELLMEGHRVFGVDSFDDVYPPSEKEANLITAEDAMSFKLTRADILDMAREGTLAGLVASVDQVFHFAARAGLRGDTPAEIERAVDEDAQATRALLDAAKDGDVSAFVYASSAHVYAPDAALPIAEDAPIAPRSPEGHAKLAGEELCRQYSRDFGLHTVSLRLFSVYGARQRPGMAFREFIEAALAGRPLTVYGDGSQVRDFVHIEEVIPGIMEAANAPAGSTVNLASGIPVSLNDAVEVLRAILDVPIVVEYAEGPSGAQDDSWASIGQARALLGYNPRITLEQGLREQVRWARAQR